MTQKKSYLHSKLCNQCIKYLKNINFYLNFSFFLASLTGAQGHWLALPIF